MDSRDVSRAIRATIHPLLRRHGFSQFTERSAWRYTPAMIHVVNFQAMRFHWSRGTEGTAQSFAVNLGIYYPAVPEHPTMRPIRERRGWLAPEEGQCHLRMRLLRAIDQVEQASPDIWSIDVEGQAVPRALEEIAMLLVRDAMPWFARYSDIAATLRLLMRQSERGFEEGAWASGANPSPQRSYVIGYLAWAIGDRETAARYLHDARQRFEAAAAATPLYAPSVTPVVERIAEDITRLAAGLPPHASDAGS